MAVQNAENVVLWGSYGGTQSHRQCHNSIERIYDFLFDFNRNHASIFYRFRDTAGYLSKVADYDPPAFGTPVGLYPVEFRGDLWLQKTRVPALSCDVVYVILRLAVLVELRLVTDGQTQYRGCIASRGN